MSSLPTMYTCLVCGERCRLVHRYPGGVAPPERTTHSAQAAIGAAAREPEAVRLRAALEAITVERHGKRMFRTANGVPMDMIAKLERIVRAALAHPKEKP